jgi:hypothetical protein
VTGTECSTWADECGPCHKCMPNADRTGMQCSPLDPNPKAIGEPCISTDQPDGVVVDDCEGGAMCYGTVEPVCVGFCQGSPTEPTCLDPNAACATTGDGIGDTCHPGCNPLAATCPSDQGCYVWAGFFFCRPGSPEPAGQMEACSNPTDCDPTLLCVSSDMLADCGALACCTKLCDLDAPSCPPGLGCQLYFTEPVLPGYERLGVCISP